jgi:hypothetical protein
MPYSAFTARAIPYHLDGTVIKMVNQSTGVTKTFSGADLLELNNYDYVAVDVSAGTPFYCVVFFPELRDIKSVFCVNGQIVGGVWAVTQMSALEGSADTTNGMDGTWSAATVAAYPPASIDLDAWRKNIKSVSSLDGVKAIRFNKSASGNAWLNILALHLYGNKTAGQTVDDILFLDAENSDAEYTIPQDFGDRPSGTSVQHQFKIKNASATKTASTVTLTVTDPNDIIRISDSSSGPWVTSKVINSLGPNTKSSVIYIKCETPAPPTPLGPQRSPISVTVGSWA